MSNDKLGDFGVYFGRLSIIYAFILPPSELLVTTLFGTVGLMLVDYMNVTDT